MMKSNVLLLPNKNSDLLSNVVSNSSLSVCFASEVQTRMTAKEATIDKAHMLVTGNTIKSKIIQLNL